MSTRVWRWLLIGMFFVGFGVTGCTDGTGGLQVGGDSDGGADTGGSVQDSGGSGPTDTGGCIGDECGTDPDPALCNPLTDEDCPCRAGQMRLCSSHGDPLNFGTTSPCQAGVQRCLDGEWEETCHGEHGPEDGEVCEGPPLSCGGVINEQGECVEGPIGAPVDPNVLCPEGATGGMGDRCSCEVPEGAEPGQRRRNQPCYSGPIETLGVGICRAGFRDCEGDTWGPCFGEVTPQAEICGDGLDNNCNGVIDDGCPNCPGGVGTCEGGLIDPPCDDGQPRNACGGCGPAGPVDICGDGLDNNCSGTPDEGCPCTDVSQPCYAGPPENAGVGVCQMGTQFCLGEFWGPCEGDVMPTIELCGPDGTGNGQDNNCNGIVDDGCGCVEGSTRPCGSDVGACERGTQTCSDNSWGPCEGAIGPTTEMCDGVDNNCNGIVDDNLRNACGTCGDSCYLHNPDPTVSGNIGDGAEPIAANDPDNPTGRSGLTLASQSFIPPYLWAANHTNHTVSKFNTDTGEEEGIYWVAVNASRTAVDLDGNVWVVGRDDGRLTKVLWDSSNCVNTSRNVNGVVTRVNSQANPLADDCVVYSAVPDPSRPSIRGVAAAPDGTVWFGYTAGGIQSINPHTFELGPYIPAAGAPLYAPDANYVQQPVMSGGQQATGNTGGVYGMVVDSQGYVYTSSFTRDQLARFDTSTGQWDALYTQFDCGSYGIAIDSDNRIWVGGWPGCPGIGMFDPATRRFHNFTVPNTVGPTPGQVSGVEMNREIGNRCGSDPRSRFCVTGVAVEPATGDVWASFYPIGYTGRLVLNNNDLAQSQWHFIATTRAENNSFLPGVSADLRGVGFDRQGYAWTLGLGSDRVWKIDPDTNARAADMPLGKSIGIGSHYTYSDFTGSTALNFTAPRSMWRYTYDTGFSQAQLDAISLEAYAPAETTVDIRVRALDTNGNPSTGWVPAESQGAPQYMRYPTGAAEHRFEIQGGLVGAYFEVEVRMATNTAEIRPIIHDLKLFWQRP